MNLKPIIQELRDYAVKVDPCEWEEDTTPTHLWEFQQNVKTSSDDFWYSLNNGYINLSLITDTPLRDLTKQEIDEIEDIVNEFGIEW